MNERVKWIRNIERERDRERKRERKKTTLRPAIVLQTGKENGKRRKDRI